MWPEPTGDPDHDDVIDGVVVEERGQAQVLLVHVEPGAEVTQAIMSCLDDARVGRVVTREPTLEDAYIELVGTP